MKANETATAGRLEGFLTDPIAYIGFLDARAGQGFRPEYDTWTVQQQWYYEIARLFGVCDHDVECLSMSERCVAAWRDAYRSGAFPPPRDSR